VANTTPPQASPLVLTDSNSSRDGERSATAESQFVLITE